MNSRGQFGVYESDGSLIDCARWIIFLRAWCLIQTPACIYTIIESPETYNAVSNIKIAPVPAYVSNIICDLFAALDHGPFNINNLDAREGGQTAAQPIVLAALRRRRGGWHYGDDRVQLSEGTMRLAVRTVMPWALLQVHNDSPCDGRYDRVVAALSQLVARGYNALAKRVDCPPAALTLAEGKWVAKWAGDCRVSLKGIYDGCD